MKLMFDSWRDLVEVLFFSTLFYYLTLWLKRDATRNLVPYFYGILLIGFTAYSTNLSAISTFLFLFAPSLAALFILIHQETLQRNLVSLHTLTAAQKCDEEWIELFIRACLSHMNQNKELVCVIENKDSLSPFLECSLNLRAHLTTGLLQVLLESALYDSAQMLWIAYSGELRGINVTWKTPRSAALHSPAALLSNWHDDAHLYTSKTDCIILHVNPTKRCFTLVAQGTSYENIPPHTIIAHLEKHISKVTEAQKKKGVIHAISQAYSASQRTT